MTMHVKMSSANRWPFYLSLNVLSPIMFLSGIILVSRLSRPRTRFTYKDYNWNQAMDLLPDT